VTIAEQITRLTDKAVTDHVFPGCVVGYLREGKQVVMPFGRFRYGDNEPAVTAGTVYDVASITKSIPTACIILTLVEQGLLTLDDKVIDYVPELTNSYRDQILIRHLLTYTVEFELPRLSVVARETPAKLLDTIFTAQLTNPPGTSYAYTNAPAIILGIIIERVYNRSLGEAAQAIYGPIRMKSTSFSSGRLGKDNIAPSEVNWRGEVQGQVHDEAAWALSKDGRIAGDAGLFTTAGDLLTFAQMLLNGGKLDGHRYFEPSTVKMMHTNQIAHLGKSTGMGWQLNYPQVMGEMGSDQLFGKTGFTGCIILIDPKKQIALAHVSNFTYPKRPEPRDAIDIFRRALANIIFDDRA
jgi:CubicO group peptidase (beta-lactamase class C family)